MAKDVFAGNPTISISRSKFVRNSQHKTAFKLGEIIPIYFDEVLPDDTRVIDFASLLRMSNPIAPVMDNIYVDYYAFYSPSRLLWKHWKEFMGENTTGAGIYQGTEYTIPKVGISKNPSSTIKVGDVGDYLGLPVGIVQDNIANGVAVSALPMRFYRLVYNRWFRDQNLISPVPVNLEDTTNGYDNYNVAPFKAAKVHDYFTSALPFAQKGAPVTVSMGTTAPVTISGDGLGLYFKNADGSELGRGGTAGPTPLQISVNEGRSSVPGSFIGREFNEEGVASLKALEYKSGLEAVADLSSATAMTINQLRFAFQYQKMLEKDAMYGTRYWEILKAHFGVDAPDASLQDPEYLGHHRTYINIDQVIQTTGIDQAVPAQNELGQVAGNSVTGDKCSICTKSFTEHGYIMIVAVARHDQTYGQGINRLWSRDKRTDFYFPVFANLGSQSVLNQEIYAQGKAVDKEIFGYQEAWSEYRYKPSLVTGLLNPAVANSLGYWSLANNFASLPTLGQTFIEQDRGNLARALSTGSTGPDFIADFAFRDVAVRAIPMYSIPGLIDHH